MKYSDEGIYIGTWDNDKRAGKGKMTYPNKTIYEGEWMDDVKHGFGT